MAQVSTRGLSASQRTELWERWKAGQTLSDIGNALGKHAASIFATATAYGGIALRLRRRSRLALTLEEREEISRGLAAGDSIRTIAAGLGQAPSTVSREIRRHSAGSPYRAPPPMRGRGRAHGAQKHVAWHANVDYSEWLRPSSRWTGRPNR